VLLLKEGSALLERTKKIFAAYVLFDILKRRKKNTLVYTAIAARW
jgi:hypothetical protein